MNFCESTVVVKCWIAFVAGPVVHCQVQAAIWDFVHVERSFNARKDEASEQNGSECHGYVDAEQNSVPECLRQNLYKQLRTTIKMLKNDKKKSKLILKELISVAFQLRLRMSKMIILKQIPRSSSRRTCGKFTVSNLRLTYSQQSKLLGRNGVKKICVRPSLLVLVFSSIWEFFFYQAWMHWMSSLWRLTGMNALVKQCHIPTWRPQPLLPADLFNQKSIG